MSGLGCFFLATPFHTMLTNSVPYPRVSDHAFLRHGAQNLCHEHASKIHKFQKASWKRLRGKNTRAKDKHLSTNLPIPVSKRRWGKGKEKPEENQKIYISILVRFAAAAKLVCCWFVAVHVLRTTMVQRQRYSISLLQCQR